MASENSCYAFPPITYSTVYNLRDEIQEYLKEKGILLSEEDGRVFIEVAVSIFMECFLSIGFNLKKNYSDFPSLGAFYLFEGKGYIAMPKSKKVIIDFSKITWQMSDNRGEEYKSSKKYKISPARLLPLNRSITEINPFTRCLKSYLRKLNEKN